MIAEAIVLRLFVASLAVALPLCIPMSGGSSGPGTLRPDNGLAPGSPGVASWSGSMPSDPAGVDRIEWSAEVPSTFPRFLKPLPGHEAARTSDDRGRARDVLLTFDDGPDLLGTSAVLAELDRRGLKGVFFVAGHRMMGSRPSDLARRDLVRKLAAHGHLVANHTVNHRNLCRERDQIAGEVDANSEMISYATGLRPLLFRSPYGARCRSLDQALRQRDLVQVGWNIDPQDWRVDDADAIVRYVTRKLARLEGPGIVLLHDTHGSAVSALPRILDWIEEEKRRVAARGGLPIRIVDYSVLLPARAIPPTGLEPLARALWGRLWGLRDQGTPARRERATMASVE